MENPTLAHAYELASRLSQGLSQVIRGRQDTLSLVLTALFAGGHALLEDYPGSGKTTLAKTLGRLISGGGDGSHTVPFRRIQFTPDLLPGDVLGVNVFDPQRGSFQFHKGPVFANIILADEINRAGPKVQSAFLECMAEGQVTLDNVTYPLERPFFVIGTQNPLDMAGTYPLPQVQLDRFLLKIPMSYVSAAVEEEILAGHNEIIHASQSLAPICTRQELLEAQKSVGFVEVHELVRKCIVGIVQSTRSHPLIHFGASTRAALMAQSALRAWALIHKREYVTEDDVKQLMPYVLLHRIKFHGGAGEPSALLQEIIQPHLESLISQGIS